MLVRPTTRASLACALLIAAACSAAWGQASSSAPTQLKITGPPELVDCAPVTQSPCMSLGLTPANPAGLPAPVTLPSASRLASMFTLRSAAGEAKPFFASAGLGPDAAQHGSVVLLLVDISGSMNQPSPGSTTRFAAVQNAVSEYLRGMQEGTDRIAIVPFQSHNVISTIRSAVYASTRADALSQLHALPAPEPKNNTALYQAVFTGIESLQGQVAALSKDGRSPQELTPHLILMTDGKNEVLPGDDPQLLNGDLGLQQAAAQVRVSHFDVIGIGFGDRAAIDTIAMQKLSTRFFYAADATQLLAALHVSQSALSHQLQITWILPALNRTQEMGRDQLWTPEMRLEDGTVLPGPATGLIGPATAAPVYRRKASPAELAALILLHPPADSGWSGVLLTLLLAVLAAAALLVLWFWVPRLVWGERYRNALPERTKRWSSERPGVTSATGVQIRSGAALPSGFDPTPAAGPIQRSAAQTTQILPRGELSRTRLTFDR